MCNGNYCELRDTCYRYKAEPTPYRQAYFAKTPVFLSYQCDYYWKVCEYCHQENGVHKMSCPTQKIQIRL